MAASPAGQLAHPVRRHLHVAGELCPYCEQPIPNEKADQVRARAEARERELSDKIAGSLSQKFALEKAQIEDSAKALVEQTRTEAAAALERVKGEIEARSEEIRAEAEQAAQDKLDQQQQATAVVVASLQERIAAAEQSKLEATTQVEALNAAHDVEVSRRVQEVRDAMATDKTNALNAINARHFEETQKLTGKLEDLTRQLEKRTANDLGEGAEIDLYEALKSAFDGDRIRRVGKGNPGADIIHEILHNGRVCGVIVYDSKNRNAWRNDYVTKLRQDQLAAKAEHAILAALKFPADRSQLHVQEGVIVANPARVIALAQLLRRHIVQVHTLRLSNDERSMKTAALYDFIRSDQCQQLFDRIDSQAEDLLKLQAQEKKAHDTMWNRQGTIFRGIQKSCSELTSEIDRIIGTAAGAPL